MRRGGVSLPSRDELGGPFFDIHAQMCFWRPAVTWFVSDPLECDGRGEIGTIPDCISRPGGKKHVASHFGPMSEKTLISALRDGIA